MRIVTFLMKDESIILQVQVFKEISFNDHVFAYVVQKSKEDIFIKQNELPVVTPVFLIVLSNVRYILVP